MRTAEKLHSQPAATRAETSEARSAGPVPRHPLMHMQRTAGNQAVLRQLGTRAKPVVNTPGDRYEQEADQTAAALMQPGGALHAAPAPAGETGEGGQPLPPAVRSYFEPRFGRDFGHVRIHTGEEASRSAADMGARAYTLGTDIVFGDDEYSPESRSGLRLIAHELAHVVQQESLAGDGPVMREEKTPGEGTSLGVLDTSTANTVMGTLVGDVRWPILREALRGFVGTLENQPSERYARMQARFEELTDPFGNWGDKKNFAAGYGKGILLGLWDSVKGLFELLIIGPKMQYKLLTWLMENGPGVIKHWDVYQAKLGVIWEQLGELAGTFGQELLDFIKDPEALNKISAAMDSLMKGAQTAARSVGGKVASSMLEFMELPWDQFGSKIGYVVGMALFEVLLAIATQGAGTLVKAGGSVLARMADDLIGALRWAGDMALELIKLLKQTGKGLLSLFTKSFDDMMKLLDDLYGLLMKLVDDLVQPHAMMVTPEGIAIPMKVDDAAKAGGAMSKGSKGGKAKAPEVPPKQVEVAEEFAHAQKKAPRREMVEEFLERDDVRETKTPGGKPVPQKFDSGNFAHKWFERLEEWGIPTDKIPAGLRAEYPVPGGGGRIDRLDRANGIIYEIKPNTAESMAAGKKELELYKAYMDLEEPLGEGRKWQVKLVTYDQAKLLEKVRQWGYLPK